MSSINVAEPETLSDLDLCDQNTSTLCDAADRIANILAIYHRYIVNFNADSSTHTNLLKQIQRSTADYDLISLRDDYHHIVTYHDSNKYFMKLLFASLMAMNRQHDIEDLAEVNQRLDADQTHFGHNMHDEISMIQTLNQAHYDCTHKFSLRRKSKTKTKASNHGTNHGETHRKDEEDEGSVDHSMHSDHEVDPEIDDGDKEEEEDEEVNTNLVNISKESAELITSKPSNPSSSASDDGQEDAEDDASDDDDDDDDGGGKTKRRKAGKKVKKGGYMKSKVGGSKTSQNYDFDTAEVDDMQHVDARYEEDKSERERRKIGRLKLKKPKPKQSRAEKQKAGPKKVVDDDSWMDKSHQKRSKHVVSESITMLGSTRLVSKNSFKSSLDSLNEESNGFDLNDLDLEQLTAESTPRKRSRSGSKSKSKKKRSSMFDDNYDVNM
eukprot:CAMPEP_0197023230 /NCGR_PEP_ID=MMETSP1384-20130603/3993_1 /TAXON_ID=29189 /ORGANISM="Ammonia sp." /LENGTH=437 /DNA_ID=CAMNT_0042451421 /DNA_START=149 /DNA_END=1462 /DNA_ORIENTATION=+